MLCLNRGRGSRILASSAMRIWGEATGKKSFPVILNALTPYTRTQPTHYHLKETYNVCAFGK